MKGKPTIGTLFGGSILFFAVINTIGAQMNRSIQTDIGALQAQLNRTRTFLQVDNALVQLLARTAADKDDAQLRALLARNGVTFRKGDPATPSVEAGK